jgi:cytochrome P450
MTVKNVFRSNATARSVSGRVLHPARGRGNDTTRTAISRGMHLLSQNPDQRRVWQDDFDGVTMTAVEEIVRVASPVTFMRRTATNTARVGDHEFAEGDKVVLLYGVVNP